MQNIDTSDLIVGLSLEKRDLLVNVLNTIEKLLKESIGFTIRITACQIKKLMNEYFEINSYTYVQIRNVLSELAKKFHWRIEMRHKTLRFYIQKGYK